MTSTRSLIVSRSRASWALKLAISLMVLTLSSSLKLRFEARQVVVLQILHQALELGQRGQADVDLGGLCLEGLLETAHGVDDALGQARETLVFGIDARLQAVAHVLFAVVAGFHRELVVAQDFGAPSLKRVQQHIVECGLRLDFESLRMLCLGSFVLAAGFSAFALCLAKIAFDLLQALNDLR